MLGKPCLSSSSAVYLDFDIVLPFCLVQFVGEGIQGSFSEFHLVTH